MKKTFTLSNLEIMDADVGLGLLAQEKMAVVPGFLVAKNKSALKPHVADFMNYRKEILNRYGHKDHTGNLILDANGDVIFNTPENKDTALQELDELMHVTVELTLEIITLSSLSGLSVPPNVLGSLLWMLDEGEKDET
jgi:hypothetical protein